MKRKLLSIMLSGAMVLSMFSLSASAIEENTNFSIQQIHQLLSDRSIDLDENIEVQIQTETDCLTKIGLLGSNTGTLTSVEILSTNSPYENAFATIEYTIDYDGVQNSIIFNGLSDTHIDFTAYDKNNEIKNDVLLDHGQIFLDGVAVKTSESPSLLVANSLSTNSSRRVSDTVYQVACPYGTAADYNVYVGESRTKNITFSKNLKNTVYSAALTIVGAAMGMGLVMSIFTSTLYTFLQDSAPTSYGISCIDDKYWHKSCGPLSGGHISAYGRYVTKHVFNWYPEVNFDGIPKLTIEYEIKVIY